MRSQSVLDSVDGDQDRAIEALLGMSDPDYVSKDPPQRPRVRLFTLACSYTTAH